MPKLLSREAFKAAVFTRDKNKCVICGQPAVDAHHVIERRLFPDGGYVSDNGAAVCSACHLKAEQTAISCEELRQRAGITNIILPVGFDPSKTYTKWGDIILPDGRRTPGPLFGDPGVQKVLKRFLWLYS